MIPLSHISVNMEKQIKQRLNDQLKWIPFKGVIINKIMPVISSLIKLNTTVDDEIATTTKRLINTQKEINELYVYPKQVELGEKTPYQYHDYLKAKVRHESAKFYLVKLLQLRNEIQ